MMRVTLGRLCALAVAAMAAGCGSPAAPSGPTGPPSGEPAPAPSPAVSTMLAALPGQIMAARQYNLDLLPRNPQFAPYVQAKNAILESPTLANDIVQGRRYAEREVTSIDGRPIPLVTVFMTEDMRMGANGALGTVERALTFLEDFLDTPFPFTRIWMWYGFYLGARGGSGVLYLEDRQTFDTRGSPLPYDAILAHELAHSYILHEGLNQFLEVYLHNRRLTGSEDIAAWIYFRDGSAGGAVQSGVALVEVYRLIGPDAMSRAYQRAYTFHPPYGVPLAQEVKQAFIAESPDALKAQVAAWLEDVIY